MRAEVREVLGKVAHQAMVRYFDGKKSSILTKADWTWEGIDEETKELYRCEAESVVKEMATVLIVPVLRLVFTEEDVNALLQQLL